MTTFSWKSDENIDVKARTIVKTTPVPASEKTEEFNLGQKENELASAEESLVNAQTRVDDLTSELETVKTELEIE